MAVLPDADRPDPVKLLAFVLWREEDALEVALEGLARAWGPIDFEGAGHPFDVTGYYDREMGLGLLRRVVSFARLVRPDALPELKRAASTVEEALRGPGGRRVNIDPAVMDVHKVVLASSKPGAPKVYVGGGVYADLACRYSKGRFHPFEWTFGDLKDGRYEADLLRIRERYKAGLRGLQ